MIKKIRNINSLECSAKFLVVMILFVLPLYVLRFGIYSLASNLVEVLILFLLFFWIAAKRKDLKSLINGLFLRNGRYLVPILLVICGVSLSIVAGGNFRTGVGVLKGWFVLPLIFALIASDLARGNKKLIETYLKTIFYSGAALSFFGLFFWLSGNLTYDGRLRMFYDSPNQLAMTLAPAFLLGIKFSFEEVQRLISNEGEMGSVRKKIRGSLLAFVGLVLLAFALLLTKSFGAWFALLASLVIVYSKTRHVKKIKKGLVILLVALIVIGSLISWQNTDLKVKLIGSRSSLSSRMMIWKSALLIARDNPVFGVGPGNFQNKYLEYQKYFSPYLEWSVPQPHNLFLAFWLEAGALGLIGFIWLLVVFFVDNKKAVNYDRRLGLIFFAIILYFILHGLIDTTYWKNDSAVIFWLVIFLNYLVFQKTEDNI